MRKFLDKIKFNILVYTILYELVFILLKLILNACGIEFMQWIYNINLIIVGIGFLAGILQIIIKAEHTSTRICTIVCLGCILSVTLMFWQIPVLFYVAYFPPEHIVEKEGRKMVGYVRAFLRTEVDYYDYYNVFFRGKYRLIEEDYGKGGFDPFNEKTDYKHEIQQTTYYDKNGKVIDAISNNSVANIPIKDSHSANVNHMDNSILDKNINHVSKDDILYEKQIHPNTRIRVINLGAILAQKSIVRIEKSTDDGQTWLSVHENSEEAIQIHNGAEFVFINEKVGFINDPGLAGTDGENSGLMVTTNGGKTFETANIIHPNTIEERNLLVKGVPYEEQGILKIEIYTINYSKNPEKTYYEFTSKNNGKDWKYSRQIKTN